MDPLALVDLERYPVTDLGGCGGAVAAHHTGELQSHGVSILPGFIRAEAVFANNRQAVAEALAAGRAGLPVPTDVADQRDDAWNPCFRSRPAAP